MGKNNMRILKGLSPRARELVSLDFRKGNQATVDATDYVSELELGRTIDTTPIHAVVDEAMKRFTKLDPWKSDPWLGPRIHSTLRLTRREAADKRLWEYLTVIEFPNYVRWRWADEESDSPVTLDRFLGEDSKNAIARLWWASELTRNGFDYSRTEKALDISRFSVSWFKLNVLHHRPAALASVDFLATFGVNGATSAQGQIMAKAVNLALRTVCLDSLAASPPTDAEAVREWIAEKIDETTMMNELPKGPDEAPVSDADIAAVRNLLDDLAVRINLAEAKAPKRGRPTKAEMV